jgi:trehalose 6-phosphate phosphatase
LKSFFSREGRAALEALPPGKTLFAFDFDGTLAPIVADPEDAFTLKNLRPLMRKLDRLAPVAVISGRAVADLDRRLLFPYRYIVGNHGLEGLPEFRAKAAKAKAVCRKWHAQLERDLRELPPGHGIYVEDKKHSLSLHYRHSKNPIKTMSWLSDEIDNLWPEARVIGGKLIFNIVPKNSPHKGSALKALMKRFRCSHAVFVGDDVTDEDAFAEKGRILAIRVGRKKDSLARFYIHGQNEMPELLKAFLGRLS